MIHPSLENAISATGIDDYIVDAHGRSLARSFAMNVTPGLEQPTPERLPHLAYMYELQGIESFESEKSKADSGQPVSDQYFEHAFDAWESLATLPDNGRPIRQLEVSSFGLKLVRDQLEDDIISPELSLAFHLAVCALLGGLPADARLMLRRFDLKPTPLDDWSKLVCSEIVRAFVLLVRKQGGWKDIEDGVAAIDRLRQIQNDNEKSYLQSKDEGLAQAHAAAALVGLYHLAQIVTLAGKYLVEGKGTLTQLNLELDRHRDRALAAFDAARMTLLIHFSNLLWAGCSQLCQNSIWTHMRGLGESVEKFANLIAGKGRVNPVIELWPSQQAAFSQSLLDPYKRAVLVQMPTSAGKTLLAKFSIVQARALNPNGTIAYLAPTRALVNQVTNDLRADFSELPLVVEQAVPAFEMNPAESSLLATRPDVLVTTPEKLDLLIKSAHSAVANLALVIADEAHNVGDSGTRGARLELLLGTIKRERANVRFLLLSPFLPNADELAEWLGDDRALSIKVDWRPGHRVVGSLMSRGRKKKRATYFTTLHSAANVDTRAGLEIPIAPGIKNPTKKGLTRVATSSLLKHGSVLVLCRGTGTAETRATELAQDYPVVANPSELLTAVCNYLTAETGIESQLVRCLKRRIAFHHSGLSPEARWLVERLIAKDEVKIVCGTTTLAQGMNFPIRTVIVETARKGDQRLSHQDFWNIAGRAGRALLDSIGVIAFPAESAKKEQEWTTFLQQDAQEVASQLASLIDQADVIAQSFNMATVRNWPAMAELMRFLAHAMRVSGKEGIADEVEDVLRASLAYHQIRKRSSKAATKLVALSRAYLQSINHQSKGMLTLADSTGFATPSVLWLLAKSGENPQLRDINSWEPDRLFGDNIDSLALRMQTVSELPEMSLGDGSGTPFNSRRVAAILRDWVSGQSLQDLANTYGDRLETDDDRRLTDFSKYLFSKLLTQASWGLGALEGVCLAGNEELEKRDAAYVPSMVYFGVPDKAAVWLRMAGVPRVVASGLASQWPTQDTVPKSFKEIRDWVGGIGDNEWTRSIPGGMNLNASQMRLLWREFSQ